MNKELGITFRSEPQTPGIISETARRYGFEVDMLGVYDDLGDMSPVVGLVAAAQSLDRRAETRIGPVGFVVPKQASMVDVVGYMATLNDLRPGKVFLGLVPGAWTDAVGLKPASVQQMREAVESARYLLQKRDDGYQGRFYRVTPGFRLHYETPSRMPVLLGAYGPNLVALAGEVANELKVGGSANPTLVPIMRERLAVGAGRIGRDPEDIGIVFGAVSVVDEDRKRALGVARKKALGYIGVVGEKDPTLLRDYPKEVGAITKAVKAGDGEEALRHLPDELARRLVFAGSPDDVIGQAETLFEAGVKRIEFGTPHGVNDELSGIELLVKKVFPYFRR